MKRKSSGSAGLPQQLASNRRNPLTRLSQAESMAHRRAPLLLTSSQSSSSSDSTDSPVIDVVPPVFQERNVPDFEIDRTRMAGAATVPSLSGTHHRQGVSRPNHVDLVSNSPSGSPRHARQTTSAPASPNLRIPHLANVPVTNHRTMLQARRMVEQHGSPPTGGEDSSLVSAAEGIMAAGSAALTSLQLRIPGSPSSSGYPSPTTSFLSSSETFPYPYHNIPSSSSLPRDPTRSSQTVPLRNGQGPSKHAAGGSTLKRAGPYLLGPRLGTSPVRSIVQCLARKEGTDDFYSLKVIDSEIIILTLPVKFDMQHLHVALFKIQEHVHCTLYVPLDGVRSV